MAIRSSFRNSLLSLSFEILPILCAWLRVLLIFCLGKSSIFGLGKDFSGKGGKSSKSTKSSSESSSDPTRSENGFRFRLKCWHKSVVQFFYEIDWLTDSDCKTEQIHKISIFSLKSFLRRQLLIANYHVKKFVRNSQLS